MYPHLKKIRDNLWSKDGKSRVSVMVGAGFSLNASKIEDNFPGMALWNDLNKMMTENLSHRADLKDKDVLEIGQLYEEEYGRANLDEILKEAIPDDNYEPDFLHNELLNLPWADIYTTNYDTLLERAKRNVFDRNYQVVYDVNDIPNSTSPRIIKLHGSFPSNRPFIFTKNDYLNYPERFSPFVNMVQQSIMETTFVLLGFSGDDPNFERWTTWVRDNLGEQMPKIYMIGYKQKNRKEYLKSKGITLIDFEDLYSLAKNPFQEMFAELFEFLAYKNREEKIKWPYRPYGRGNVSDFKYNRETYPGWIVMPDDIRRSYSENIRLIANNKIADITSLNDKVNLEYINELLWCFEHFYIPLEYNTFIKLEKLIEENINNLDSNDNNILLLLLKEARLDCKKEKFYKYKSLLEKTDLENSQYHKIIHEEILFNLAFNNIENVKEQLDLWQVGEKEIEWGIKKAAILINISRNAEAKETLEKYLHMIRGLLAIQSDEYRLLSLESVVLSLLRKIDYKLDYGEERLRNLNLKKCNSDKEFNLTLISVKKYEYTLGTKKIPGFDPGKSRISSSFGDYFKSELLDSFAVLQIQENFNLNIGDRTQYELALNNIEIQYPLYSFIKGIHYFPIKKIDEIFSRAFVYKLDDYNLEILIEMLKDTIAQKKHSIINVEIALEIISRIYFALPIKLKVDLDLKIINFIKNKANFKFNRKDILYHLIERVIFDKDNEEQKLFYEQLLDSPIHSQLDSNKNFDVNDFFEPFLAILSKRKNVSNVNVSESKILELLGYLKNNEDQSKKESALIRMFFLEKTNSLSTIKRNKFVEALKNLETNRQQGISDFIFQSELNKIMNSSSILSDEGMEFILSKNIPTFYNNGSLSSTHAIEDYFNELSGIFPNYIESKTKTLPKSELYKEWLEKFFTWWDDQEKGLLRSIPEEIEYFPMPDYLKRALFFLKDNILGVIPSDFLSEDEIEKFQGIFEKIDIERPTLSIFLIASFEQLQIPIKYDLDTVLDTLKSKEIDKMEAAAYTIFDYLLYIEEKKIVKKSNLIKNELFSMMYYGSEDIFKVAINILEVCIKNIPRIFIENEYMLLIKFLDSYLDAINSEKIIITTLKDFEKISSVAGLMANLYRNQNIIPKEDLKHWKEFIESHRLPEVRVYRELLN
ncbi:hypothetical protein AN960_21250 [Bacillus sp. FJAT-25509]|nr:hypothetical protein AN960_21250 [Bacillus sp. FJAT-25509]